jgi:hypothetical protein
MALGLFVLALWRLNRLSSEFQREEDVPRSQDSASMLLPLTSLQKIAMASK